MQASDIIHLPDPRERVQTHVREVVRDIDERPHVFLRVKLTGWFFPQRAQEPFLLIGDAVSRLTVIAPDGLSAAGYFDRQISAADVVSFGYGRTVEWNFPVRVGGHGVDRLDRFRLPKDVVDPFARPGPPSGPG